MNLIELRLPYVETDCAVQIGDEVHNRDGAVIEVGQCTVYIGLGPDKTVTTWHGEPLGTYTSGPVLGPASPISAMVACRLYTGVCVGGLGGVFNGRRLMVTHRTIIAFDEHDRAGWSVVSGTGREHARFMYSQIDDALRFTAKLNQEVAQVRRQRGLG